ncbi:uncharacterized protein C8Q71DRAFT_109082 [Rhodofomes roseus]|uniref:C2H2-type domain-containing protein n=1 Tax=Rhodofomes roseus TaxID=34475 RepID=A0ABQ8KC85_9APHY|nr:uncharacterized protein C8Q71DRAFT_109082 [Rhodofomes roseus]KAH9835216.1 hypothetical protein C8Q71DRAFT_109082 [Rhodofomes roseus]
MLTIVCNQWHLRHSHVYGATTVSNGRLTIHPTNDDNFQRQVNYQPSNHYAQNNPPPSLLSRDQFGASPSLHSGTPNLNPPPGVHTVPCCWGSCTISLDDKSPGGMKRHLHEFHNQDMTGGPPYTCKWDTENGTPCGKPYASEVTLTRHIAAVHLKSSAEKCPHCGMPMSRKDALNRHIQSSCRKANGPPL